MEEVTFTYRGFLISHPKFPPTTGNFTANVSWKNLSYLQEIDGKTKVIVSRVSFEDAIADAKRFIDALAGYRFS